MTDLETSIGNQDPFISLRSNYINTEYFIKVDWLSTDVSGPKLMNSFWSIQNLGLPNGWNDSI